MSKYSSRYLESDDKVIRLVGPGLGFHDLYNIDEKNLKVILKALEDVFEAGRRDKAYELCKVIGAEPKFPF